MYMQKYSINSAHLVLLGFLATLAVSIALISCGDGKVIKEPETEYEYPEREILANDGLIKLCFEGSQADYCKDIIAHCTEHGYCPSSDSEEPSSSSGEEEVEHTFACAVGNAQTGKVGEPFVPIVAATCDGEVITDASTLKINNVAWVLGTAYTPTDTAALIFKATPGDDSDCSGIAEATCAGSIAISPEEEVEHTFACAVDTTQTGKVGEPFVPIVAATCDGEVITDASTLKINNVAWALGTAYTPTDTAALIFKATPGDDSDCSGIAEATCAGSIAISPPDLTCDYDDQKFRTVEVNGSGTNKDKIKHPIVMCNGDTILFSTVFYTEGNIDPYDQAGKYVKGIYNLKASVECPAKKSPWVVDCGKIYVGKNLECNLGEGATGAVGVPIAPVPTVTCNDEPVTAGFTWTPADLTPTASGEVTVEVEVGSGDCSGEKEECGSVVVTASSSSSEAGSSSSVGGEDSSSSTGASSSSAAQSSSSENSSSSSTPVEPVEYTFSCTFSGTGKRVGEPITPTVTAICSGGGSSSSVVSTWTINGSAWTQGTSYTPKTSGLLAFEATAGNTGNCANKIATCTGSITISPAELTCVHTETNALKDKPISAPAVKCNDVAVPTADLTWVPANLTPTATGTFAVSVNVGGTGDCKTTTAKSCGSVTVTAPPACDYDPEWCGGKTFATVVSATGVTNSAANTCYFATDFAQLSVYNSATIKVNGVDITSQVISGNICSSWGDPMTCPNWMSTTPSKSPAKKDGGYYIYMASNGKFEGAVGTKPSCSN